MTRSITRRFNYTRRVDIPECNVEIDVRTDGQKVFCVLVRLALPDRGVHDKTDWDSALVLLEAWRTDLGAYQRFDEIGMTSQIAGKSPVAVLELSEFPDEQNLTFRIKVVSSTSKRILAEADRLLPAKDTGRKDELIPVILRDLGELPWTIDWSDLNAGPKILVNSNIERSRDLLTRGSAANGIVLSAVLREVLFRAATEPEQQDWANKWREFGVRIVGGQAPDPSDESIDDWVNEVLLRFAAKHQLSSLINEELGREEIAT